MCHTIRRLAFMGLIALACVPPVLADYPDLLDAMRAGTVRISCRGAGASKVAMHIQRVRNGPLYVRVAPGTYFRPDGDVQGQVALGVQWIDLRRNGVAYVQLETACTHIHRPAAHAGNAMIPTSCPDARLLRLCSSVHLRTDNRQAIQNAVWAICNNASRRELTRHGGAGTLASTVRLLERAGVDPGSVRLKTRSTSRVLYLW